MIDFTNFSIDRGPEGTYFIDYETENGVASSMESVSMESTVEQLLVQTAPPLNIKVGVAFSPQP